MCSFTNSGVPFSAHQSEELCDSSANNAPSPSPQLQLSSSAKNDSAIVSRMEEPMET